MNISCIYQKHGYYKIKYLVTDLRDTFFMGYDGYLLELIIIRKYARSKYILTLVSTQQEY